jgi:hypothetical protein
MAGDWIKMRKELLTSPKVVRIMSACDADRFRTIGGLFAVWCLFDEQTEDGNLDGYTPQILDSIVGFPGLAEAMVSVGWLISNEKSQLIAVNFGEHNGTTAKRRASECVRKMSARHADKKRPREEKRIEEKKEKEKYTKEKVSNPEEGQSNGRETSGTPEVRRVVPAEASPLLERLPAALNTEEFRGMWMRWTAYCFHRDGRHNEPQLEMNLMTLQERIQQGGISKAITDLRYSIESGTKGRIYDSSADFSRKPAPPPAPKPDPYAGFLHIKRKASVAT